MELIYQDLLRHVPNTWVKNTNVYFYLLLHGNEYDEITELINRNSDYLLSIKSVERYQNINSYGQFIIRQQFLALKYPTWNIPIERKFVVIRKNELETALTFNLDNRRLGSTVNFKSQISYEDLHGGDCLVLIVQTIDTSNIGCPTQNADHYIEYIIDFN